MGDTMPKSATKRLRSKGNHANSQFAQCNYIKLNEQRIIMLLDEIRYCKIIIIMIIIIIIIIKFIVRAVSGCRPDTSAVQQVYCRIFLAKFFRARSSAVRRRRTKTSSPSLSGLGLKWRRHGGGKFGFIDYEYLQIGCL